MTVPPSARRSWITRTALLRLDLTSRSTNIVLALRAAVPKIGHLAKSARLNTEPPN